MTAARTLAATLEPITLRAWPPIESGRLGAWRLNASAGFSGRINSCWPLGSSGLSTLAAVAAVEAWYRARGLPPLFKLVAGRARALAGHLREQGYSARTQTLVMVGSIIGGAPGAASVAARRSAAFAGVFAEAQGRDARNAQERLGALARVPAPVFFAQAPVAAPAAIGACAVDGEWAGIFAMRTLEAFRRRGLARDVLAALLARARQSGARRAYLQVERRADPAIALYRSAGFTHAYSYSYWSREGSA